MAGTYISYSVLRTLGKHKLSMSKISALSADNTNLNLKSRKLAFTFYNRIIKIFLNPVAQHTQCIILFEKLQMVSIMILWYLKYMFIFLYQHLDVKILKKLLYVLCMLSQNASRLQELVKPTRWLSTGQQTEKFLSLYCLDILLDIYPLVTKHKKMQ